MRTIKYTGTSDAQTFDAEDMKKEGVEGFKKTTFRKGEPVEVDDAVAEQLLGKEGIFGPYSFEEVEEADTEGTSGEGEDPKGSTPQTPDQTPGEVGKTGKGTSRKS